MILPNIYKTLFRIDDTNITEIRKRKGEYFKEKLLKEFKEAVMQEIAKELQ